MSADKWEHSPEEIEYLVYEGDEFIVFIDKDIDIDWETTKKYDEKGHENVDQFNKVLNKVAVLEGIPNAHQNLQVRINYKRMIGESVARALCHDYDNALAILMDAESYIRDRNVEIARYWQLISSCLCCVVCFIVALVLWYWRSFYLDSLGRTAFFLLLSCLTGSIGATLSIIMRMGRSEVTSESEKKLHILEALSRSLAGAISGGIIAFLIRIGIVLPIFKAVEMIYLTMVVGGLVAGASERWAPSLIAKFESESKAEKKGHD